MELFWVDSDRDIEVLYKDFFDELKKEGPNNSYIYNANPYDVFLSLIRNLINHKKSIILDADFSEEELISIDLSKDILKEGQYAQEDLSDKFNSILDVFEYLNLHADDLQIEIYTSGTTGRPKKITQSLKNVIRAVKLSDKLKDSIWGFAYNPTHFAGLQVFFQAFFNQNTLIYLFERDYGRIYKDFVQYNITNMSSTPTFMKMLLPHIVEPLPSVKSMTFGGERFNSKLMSHIQSKFPNSVVKNVYASTEAGSLLRAEGEYFVIPKRFEDLIKVADGELLIHKDLLGTSSSLVLTDEAWFKTGDLVEYIDDDRFKFMNRKSDMINVGGYKVNPNEIEEVISEIEGVKDVVVFGRANSFLGNIIVASIVKDTDLENIEFKKLIKKTTRSKLQDYKVPQKINFVESLTLTRTGKIKKS